MPGTEWKFHESGFRSPNLLFDRRFDSLHEHHRSPLLPEQHLGRCPNQGTAILGKRGGKDKISSQR